ncbi:FAD-binding oxidoreductase [Roseovarius sp. A21]|uniref:FAD-binding oxidoreductase n=1 Tax=Roseovarius bejariae TaxID=2576383 RepID=A0A844CJ01_9RHOB|nr:FAD-binding oxidoreductase [Roseovarius bejariae]MRU15301.1 FAD-binding oxidoreductase [Roseovarius bejariae]
MADVTIRGAGIFGLSVAWACLQKGASVRVIDPHGPGAGASGGVVGALAPHVPENWNAKKRFQFESLLMAETFWAEVKQAGGLSSGYGRTGRLQPIADDHILSLAHARETTAKELWQDHATWSVIPATGTAWEPHSPTGFLIHDTLTARMHPRQACAALVAALHAMGAEITTDGPETGHVLHATGTAGLEDLTRHHTRTVGNGVKGQGAVLDYAMPDAPQLFADTIHIVPHADGTTAIGSTSERDYDAPDTTDAQLDEVIARARRAVPVLADAPVLSRWAGVRPRSRSRAPMLGAHPLYPGHFIANGGFKIGFGMAPKVGKVMADLMLDGADHIPPDFRPEASY